MSSAHFPDPASFQQQTGEFLNWLSSNSGVRINSKVRVTDLSSRNAGRGVGRSHSIPLGAQADLAEGEELFAIPRDLILSVENSNLNNVLGQELSELGPWMSLMLVMIYEYLARERSAWAPYFNLLPKQFDTLMFWSPAELQELQASAIVDKIGKEEADEAIVQKIVPVVRENPSLFPPIDGLSSYEGDEGAQALLRLGHIMGSLILAYAFDIEKAEDDEDSNGEGEDGYMTDEEEQAAKAMVPLADLLNADPIRHNAHLSQEQDAFVMRAIKLIPAGEEIFIDYGEIPRADLLRRYGFAADNYAQFDVVELPLSIICQGAGLSNDDVESQPPLQFLVDLDLLDDGYVIPRLSSNDTLQETLPDELLFLLRTLTLSPEQLNHQKSKNKPPKPSISQTESTVLQKAVQLKQAQYPTTIQQDQEVLAQLHASAHRLGMAIVVRIGEKEVLQELFAKLDQALAYGDAGSAVKRSANDDQDDSRRAKAART